MVARPLVAWLVQELMFKDRGRFRDPLSLRIYGSAAVARFGARTAAAVLRASVVP